jgi:hypothetical protein
LSTLARPVGDAFDLDLAAERPPARAERRARREQAGVDVGDINGVELRLLPHLAARAFSAMQRLETPGSSASGNHFAAVHEILAAAHE